MLDTQERKERNGREGRRREGRRKAETEKDEGGKEKEREKEGQKGETRGEGRTGRRREGRRKVKTEKDKERGIRDYRDFDTERVKEDISLPIAASHPAPAHLYSYGRAERVQGSLCSARDMH